MLEGRIQFDLRAAHGTQDYEAWAITLLNKSKLIDHDETRQRFMAYAQHLHVSVTVDKQKPKFAFEAYGKKGWLKCKSFSLIEFISTLPVNPLSFQL